jgi:nucleoside-triphosphatase THEP1
MEIINPKVPGTLWLKAAVIASYWAAFEIIVGSFLHNLRIPLSGTILSFVSVFLLVSFVSGWKLKGLIWRAGLICALLKSISPSAIIFGPMIGIFSEALLLEVFIWLFGQNLPGYMIGGALAVLSALLHKLVSLLILYGFDLVRILEALYKYSVKQVGLEQLSAITLIVFVTGIYLVSGMVAALLGYLTGRKIVRLKKGESEKHTVELKQGKQFISRNEGERYSLTLLGFNLLSIVLLLYFINIGWITLTITWAIIYLLFVGIRYRNSIRHLKKPVFWIQFIFITLVAALLMNSITNGVLFSMEGLIVGLNMNFRAVIVVMGFSAVGAELKNPVIRAVAFRKGFSSLYQSVNLAFSAMPYTLSAFPGLKTSIKKPMSTIAHLLIHSESMIHVFESAVNQRPSIVIITGERQKGKTSFTKLLIDELKKNNTRVAGFLAPGIHQDSKRIGFDLIDIQTGEQKELCREKKGKTDTSFRRFTFNKEGLDMGNRILSIECLHEIQLVVIDEVGPMEMRNEGWSASIEKLCENNGIMQLWTVRKPMVQQVAATWQVGEVFVFDIEKESPVEVARYISKMLNITPTRSEL